MRLLIVFLTVGLCGGSAPADQAQAVFGSHQYVEYLPGTLPIVIGAPHGGSLKPGDIPDRKEGKVMQDAFTQELARLIRDDMIRRFGAAPHLIVCRLHRSKVDCNREIGEAAQGNAMAAQAHKEFHAFISQATTVVEKQFGAGLYIDLHGQKHAEGLVEIGMLLNSEKLARPDKELDAGAFISRQSSIRELDQRSPQSFSELLRGRQSLAGLLEARGFPAIPSPTHPAPMPKQQYFSGSYSVETHGSRSQGAVSAVQIECPFDKVRETEEARVKFSADLCDALEEFFRVHFARELKISAAH